MAKKSIRPTRTPSTPSAFEEARDELFQHIMRCGVVGAEPDDQKAWFDETMSYMTERFHELNADHMAQLRMLGERFSQPPKKRDAESAA
jgi:hypothetical protein